MLFCSNLLDFAVEKYHGYQIIKKQLLVQVERVSRFCKTRLFKMTMMMMMMM